MKKNYFIFILSLISFYCIAQKNFVKGYIVSKTGDTLNGMIDNRDWQKNPSYVLFKEPFSNEVKKITPLQVKSFFVSEKGDIYESHQVSMDISPYKEKDLFSLDGSGSNMVVQDTTVFLSVLVKGTAKLYSFFDRDEKQHFYMSKRGEKYIQELILQKGIYFRNGTKYFGENKIFLNQLSILNDCTKFPINDFVEFTASSFINFFVKYNLCVGDKPNTQIRDDKSISQLFILGGISQTKMLFTNYYGDITTQQNAYPVFGLGADYVFPRNRNRLRLGVEAWLQHAGKKNLNYTNYIKINGLFKYHILVKGSIRPYLAAGYGVAINLDNDANPSFKRPFDAVGGIVGFGIVKNRWSAEARIESTGVMMNWLYAASNAYNYNLFLRYQIK